MHIVIYTSDGQAIPANQEQLGMPIPEFANGVEKAMRTGGGVVGIPDAKGGQYNSINVKHIVSFKIINMKESDFD